MEALIGTSVINNQGESFALKDVITPNTKAVALYFSAHVSLSDRGFGKIMLVTCSFIAEDDCSYWFGHE